MGGPNKLQEGGWGGGGRVEKNGKINKQPSVY